MTIPSFSDVVRAVERAIVNGVVVAHSDITVGPYRPAMGGAMFAEFVDKGRDRGRFEYDDPRDAATAFVLRVGPRDAAESLAIAVRDEAISPLDGVPVKVGARLMVVTGNRAIGIDKGTALNVDAVRLGERNSVAIRVSALRGHKTVTLHARHVNRLSEPEFSLGDGSGTNKIVVRLARAAR